MQVTYIYNLFFYKLGGVRVKLNTQIFKLVLIFQARIEERLMRLMARGETVFGERNRAHSRGERTPSCAEAGRDIRSGTCARGTDAKAMRVAVQNNTHNGTKWR